MTADPKKYFEENIRLIDPAKDPVTSNLNRGLFVLAQQIQATQNAQTALARQVRHIEEMLTSRLQ